MTHTTPVIGLLAAMHLHLVSCNDEPNQEDIVQIILQIIIHSYAPGFRKAKDCWVSLIRGSLKEKKKTKEGVQMLLINRRSSV